VSDDRRALVERLLGERMGVQTFVNELYRDRATVCTDFLAQYKAVVPEDRHAPGGKDSGLTAHVERFWLTLRQRCGRSVRKTLSFSKCPENHVGALWYFIRLYNMCRQ
jgi:IS1 family transposase